ncbi:forkhead box protein L1-like [Eriocheir sinensis]|uniref:forkhead box protein L1-like n=1 Tax=Eriocheir sinensis TaxID=95602 RepID=UPI0021C6BCB4|nr:forkhead box protein L1-like [Eriocheir sinensis]
MLRGGGIHPCPQPRPLASLRPASSWLDLARLRGGAGRGARLIYQRGCGPGTHTRPGAASSSPFPRRASRRAMSPRPASPAMDSVCGRESSVSPPIVVAPVAVKASPLNDTHQPATPTDQQRLLYQLALAERLRLASAGLAWARPSLSLQMQAPHPHHMQEVGGMVGGLVGGPFMGGLGGLGSPLMGGLGGALLGGGQAGAAAVYPPGYPFSAYGYRLVDPRALLPRGPEEPKPQHSYIGLIAMAILSVPDKKLVLSDIYQHILDHYAYFRSRGPGWRNSIRHNLSLNDCFIKSGRSANGKGHYWAIHPANVDDFSRGDFRRRRAQRRVRKHLGLAVDDDSEPETSSPPHPYESPTAGRATGHASALHLTRPKRQFDVLSLLAPDQPPFLKEPTDTDINGVCPGTNYRMCSPTQPVLSAGDPEETRLALRGDHDDGGEQGRQHACGAAPPSPDPGLTSAQHPLGQCHKATEAVSVIAGSQNDARHMGKEAANRPVPFSEVWPQGHAAATHTHPSPPARHPPGSPPRPITRPGVTNVTPTPSPYPRPPVVT